MRQAIHIFRKDVGHCWPYIAAMLSLTALHAWQASVDLPMPGSYSLLSNDSALSLLLMIVWWLAIGAAVHGESLVGERQFWTTRPYSWKSLLAAKLLFATVFMAVPSLISDCIVLLASGFNPLGLIPGLLLRQVWLAAFLVLPFVVAMLTRAAHGFALAGLISWIVFYDALSWLRPHASHLLPGMVHTSPAWIDAAAPWLAPALGVPLIVWQFARRRTALVLVLAIAGLALAPVCSALWVRIAWPDPPREDPRYRNVKVRFTTDPEPLQPENTKWRTNGLRGRIPVTFSGWPLDLIERHLAAVDTVRHVEGAAVSGYVGPDKFKIATTGDIHDWVWISVDDAVLSAGSVGTADRVADVWVSLELTLYERERRADILPGRAWTHIPGFGNVKFVEGPRGGYPVCRTAFQAADSEWTYSLRDANAWFADHAGWSILLFDPSPSPVWFSASPVFSYAGQPVLLAVTVTGGQPLSRFAAPRHDPAQPLAFTARHRVARLRRDMVVPKVRLTAYRAMAW